MAYNKDSGESKLRKNAGQDTYTHKKNRDIFKSSQTTTQPPSEPQRKTNYDWDIPDVEPQSFYEYERRKKEEQKKKESENKQELLSFKDIIVIVIANGFVPIAGGFIYYIVLSSKGEKQKAMQSLVLSAIISLIRIMYLVNAN
ncbi:MAG: hypothetical protein LBS55_04995 [Prevotellaceae bacterium]|jgi:hypothetical protein|nr:hypothetical protein [Prevotellaceae bacterium]